MSEIVYSIDVDLYVVIKLLERESTLLDLINTQHRSRKRWNCDSMHRTCGGFHLRRGDMLRSIARRVRNAQSCKEWRKGAGISSAAGDGRLAGKVALISGGASGLGLATAREFVRQDAHVIIADINAKVGTISARQLGSNAAFIQCDVTVERELAEAVDFTVSRHGRLDVMHNSAGIIGPSLPASVLELNMSEFDRVMSINVRGTILGIKHAARVMVPRGSGSILCMASVSGLMGGLGPHPYSISKFAIVGIVKAVASELCHMGIRVNCVSPFAVATPMVVEQLLGHFPKAGKEEIAELVGGFGEFKGTRCDEGDVAKAAVYLASDEAKYVSGHNLVLDGAFTCYKKFNFPKTDEMV